MKALVFLLAVPLFAANHYVRAGAGGSANGSDWTNACTGFTGSCAANGLTRGDTYYIADGTYSGYSFITANSGTSVITVKKATIADHGTSTGWSDAYGDGQAILDASTIYTDYWVFDGQSRNSNWQTGAVNQYGLGFHGEDAMRLDNGAGTGGDNITFRYVDFEGGGQGTGFGDDVIYGLAASQNITFQYCALHDSDRTIFLMRGEWQNLMVEYCYIARNSSDAEIHGEMLSDVGSDNVTFRNNVIEDIEGTAAWAVLNGTSPQAAWNTATNWKIYGNLIKQSIGYTNEGYSAIVYVANDGSQQNWMDDLYFANNTIVNTIEGNFYSLFIQGGTGNAGINNLFYSAGQQNTTQDMTYSWYYDTTENDGGANQTTCTVSCSAFFTDAATLDMTLVSHIAGSSLDSQYNTDMNGNIRGGDGTWDRGAFQLDGDPVAPTVTTTAATSIGTTTASSGGNVTSDGGDAVTVRGVCRSLSSNPTTSDTCTSDGTGTGSFSSSLSGMSPATLYHIRAYATNGVGTSYGSDLTFTTQSTSTPRISMSGNIALTGKVQ